jgi:hypothetical protein
LIDATFRAGEVERETITALPETLEAALPDDHSGIG